eukprot:jgi/Chlat1/7630/Chrsp64S07164
MAGLSSMASSSSMVLPSTYASTLLSRTAWTVTAGQAAVGRQRRSAVEQAGGSTGAAHWRAPKVPNQKLNEDAAEIAGTPAKQEFANPATPTRLWSILNPVTLKHAPGSLLSSVLLVAGTTVGAGILALPAVTREPGFGPSAITCLSCWAYMVATGLLIAEVNVNTMCALGSGGVSLVSMAERTLGKAGVRFSSAAYILLHYTLLVAYVSRAGDIVGDVLGLPGWAGASTFTLALGALCMFASEGVLGAVNNALVVGVVVSFLFLLAVAAGGVQPERLLAANWAAVPASVPVIALAFVYQNVVPVIASNLEGDLRRIRIAVAGGTAIPCAMFLMWDAVILASVPPATGSDNLPFDPLEGLRQASGLVGPAVAAFSFLAIATSYIGFVLGLSDFIADGLKLPSDRRSPLPYLLTLFPPLGLALLNPNVFFAALDVAGTYGVLVLFGIIPAAMAWSERYSTSGRLLPATEPLVPGGKPVLTLLLGGAAAIIVGELLEATHVIH